MTISLGLPMPAFAHGLFDAHLLDRAPLLLTALLVAAAWLLYLLGGRKVAPRRREALCFHAAMLLVVFSVFGPIDDWAETSTAWHMTQHMLFIIVIAPLGAGATAAAMARGHRPPRPAAMDRDPACRALPHAAGAAAWRDNLDLAHAEALCAGAGQPLVACLRACMLPVHRLAVLVVGAAREPEAGSTGTDGGAADADAHRSAGRPAHLR